MNEINPIRLGWALGVTFSLMYLGCIITMLLVGRDGTILLFNSLMHGIDVTSIIRMQMPIWEMCMGNLFLFLVGWFFGATIASLYNFMGRWL